MKIINRYVLREHAGPFIFALTALTSLLLLNYIAKRFGDLVGKGLPWQVIGEFFALSIPFTVAMTLPMSVLVATLYAFSRLAAENEITALKASGVSLVRLLIPALAAGAVLSVFMLGLNDQLLPRANHRLSTLTGDIMRKKPTFALRPRVINEVVPGQFYIQANHIDESSNRMREVTIYDMADPMRQRTIVADSGDMALRNGTDLLLTLHHGNMQEVSKQQPDRLQRLFFNTNDVRVRNVANKLDISEENGYKSDREKSICELQRDVARDERDYLVARHHLEQTLMAVAREAATGEPARFEMYSPGAPSSGLAPYAVPQGAASNYTPPPRRTLAALYCTLLDKVDRTRLAALTLPRLFGISTAFAAEPGARESLPVVADTAAVGSAPTSDSTAAPALQHAAPLPHDDTPAMLTAGAAIEGARARLTQNYQSMNSNAVEIQKKFALSVACIVFVLIGPPIALRFPRGGVGLTMGVSLVIFALYYVGLIAGETLGDRGTLPPALAMWWPNLVLGGVGVAMLTRMGAETATSRGGDFGELMVSFRLWLGRLGRRLGLNTERRRPA